MSAQSTTSSKDHLNSALSTLTSLVDDSFECAICLDIYSDPYVIPECLHRFCGACVKESIRKCGAECPTCRARISTKRGLRKDKELQDMMSKVMRAVYHLNQANDEWEDNERHTKKTETCTSTANQDANASIAKEGVTPLDKSMHDQAMTCEENSVAARSKVMNSVTTRGGARKRKSEDVSVESNKKCTRARINAVDVSRNDRSVHIQQRKAAIRNLYQDPIEHLEENIGFKWKTTCNFSKKFKQRCLDLEAFKTKFGHCRVPKAYQVEGLGFWCSSMRCAYHKIQQGKPARSNLSQDRIERLEEIGFTWNRANLDKTFEQRCLDLEAFKRKFGHCHVPCAYPADPSLGNWCSSIRYAYHEIQQGKPAIRNLSQERIERLKEIGFKWTMPNPPPAEYCIRSCLNGG